MYTQAVREVRAGQRLSVLGPHSFLYKWLPIGNLLQPGPYMGPYCTKAHD